MRKKSLRQDHLKTERSEEAKLKGLKVRVR